MPARALKELEISDVERIVRNEALVDFGLEGGFEALVGVVLAEEVGLAHEEAFAVVVAVDEPAGDGGSCGAHSGDQFGGYAVSEQVGFRELGERPLRLRGRSFCGAAGEAWMWRGIWISRTVSRSSTIWAAPVTGWVSILRREAHS